MTRLRILSGALLVAWAAWWAFFSFVQAPPLPIAAGVSILLFAIPLLAWRWIGPGGTLLILEGAFLLTVAITLPNPPITKLFLAVTLGLPPLAAGMLLVIAGRNAGNRLASSING